MDHLVLNWALNTQCWIHGCRESAAQGTFYWRNIGAKHTTQDENCKYQQLIYTLSFPSDLHVHNNIYCSCFWEIFRSL